MGLGRLCHELPLGLSTCCRGWGRLFPILSVPASTRPAGGLIPLAASPRPPAGRPEQDRAIMAKASQAALRALVGADKQLVRLVPGEAQATLELTHKGQAVYDSALPLNDAIRLYDSCRKADNGALPCAVIVAVVAASVQGPASLPARAPQAAFPCCRGAARPRWRHSPAPSAAVLAWTAVCAECSSFFLSSQGSCWTGRWCSSITAC